MNGKKLRQCVLYSIALENQFARSLLHREHARENLIDSEKMRLFVADLRFSFIQAFIHVIECKFFQRQTHRARVNLCDAKVMETFSGVIIHLFAK